MRQHVIVVVLVPAFVDRCVGPYSGGGGVTLPPERARDHPVGDDAAPGERAVKGADLRASTIGQHVVVRRAERCLGVTDQKDDWHRAPGSCARAAANPDAIDTLGILWLRTCTGPLGATLGLEGRRASRWPLRPI